jgi:hypothetical protein
VPPSTQPFSIEAHVALEALTLAEAAARAVLELRDDAPVGALHIALFRAEPDPSAKPPDPRDAEAVLAHMERRVLADHGVGTNEVVARAGYSPRDITRFKAFECLHTGVDAHEAILARRKFDGATRSYGSHLFTQMAPGGDRVALIASASGWRAEQDYLAATAVVATLRCVLLECGMLPRDGISSSQFLLSGGAWEYPDS